MRRYLINSIENMRDIGGYPACDTYVKYEKLIRSNLPNKLDKEDIEYLKKMEINTIIDLRTPEEIISKPSVFEQNENFKIYHLEMIGGKDVPSSSEGVPISYINMLEAKENIYKIFEILANENKGVLYFCNAGKDRTGVVSALILMLLGARDEDIIADYIVSQVYLKEMLNSFIEKNGNEEMRNIIFPKAEFMEKFLQMFKEKYVSIEQYLKSIGIDEKQIQNIKNKYVVKN